MDNVVLFAFFLTLVAGLATGFGSAIAFFAKKTNTGFLAFSLGLSAGVMLYVSFVEILPNAQNLLVNLYGENSGKWITLASFFGGILLIGLIDFLIPSAENPHEARQLEDMCCEEKQKSSLMRMGVFTAIAITIHNFPEGIATFISALEDPQIGISVAFAVAIHNIPEGIAVSVPIYYATNSKAKAFGYSFLSGLSEPLGAIIGFLLIQHLFSTDIMGIIFGFVAGIMVFISLDELLPAAQRYGKHHTSILGVVIGMLIMGISLLSL